MQPNMQRAASLLAYVCCALAACLAPSNYAVAQLPDVASSVSALVPSRPVVATTGQSATLLSSGQWLLLGGERDGTVRGDAILYEAGTKALTTLEAELIVPRTGHTATVIPDGSVLIIGGFGADGKLISSVERFDSDTETFELLAVDLSPRAEHTATLLTDGRLLVVGGLDAEGNARADVEILDTFTGAIEHFDSLLETARSGHLAALLPSAPVLVWGGFDQQDNPIAKAELFDPQTLRFGPIDASTVGYLPDPLAALATPIVTGTHPDTTTEVSVDAVLTARFSKPLDVATLNADTVTLFGPHGPEAAQIVAAEAGLLLFVTPASPMTPGAVYTLFISGARDASGQAMPLAALPFRTSVLRTSSPGRHVVPLAPITNPPPYQGGSTTAGSEPSGQRHGTSESPVEDAARRAEAERKLLGDDEFWVPGPEALRGDWRSKRFAEVPKLKALKAVAEVTAAEGVTAVTGHVLRLNGRPLSNVTVSMNGRVAYTDGMGRFLLANVSPGWQRLSVEGSTANRPDAQYGRHDMRVYVTAGKTNPLVWTVWLPKLDTAHAIHLDSPTQSETVLSSPYIPSLEFRVPAGTVVRDRAGNIVTEITITPVPIDQPSHPLPDAHIPGYFTVQPSGLRFESATGELLPPVRLLYPNNNPFLKVGDPATFWSYDPDEYGWQVYAEGRVTEENVIQLAVDRMHGIRNWEDGMHTGGPPAPAPGPTPCPSSSSTCPCQDGPPGGPPPPSPPDGGPISGGGGDGPGTGPPGSEVAGDPCSVSTGQFTLASLDLKVRDLMSFDVTRVYRPNDARTLAFGIGTSWPFATFIASIGSSSLPLVMANGSRIYFDNINNNTDHGGIFVNSKTPGVFYGATLTIVADPLVFTILRKDGTLYTFDSQGNLLEIRSRTGATISITRSGTQVNRITSPSGRWLSFTYSAGLISQVQDHTGRTVSYGYTSSRLTSVTNAAGGTWRYAYDANGRMSTVTDARNNVMVTNTYDTNGRVATQTYADGSSIQFAYTLDTNGNVTQTDVTDRNGGVRRVQFDAAGYISQDTFPVSTPEQQITTFTRDPTTHLLQSTTDALARRTDHTYDANGNLLTRTKLAGTANAVTTTYTYEPSFNQVASVTDPLNHTTTFGYDAAGNLTQVTDALNHATTMTYDAQGQVLSATGALNNTTSYTYDAGVLASATDPLNRTTTKFSDALGRAIRAVDPLGNATTTTYDALDRITRITDSLGNNVNYEYAANSNLTAHIDQNGNRTAYNYDAMNRQIGRQDALLHNDTYVYDPSSMIKQLTDRLSQLTGYNYDGLHRRTQIGFGATPSSPTAYTSTINYTYDAGNRILVAADSANGTITRSYDGLDRLTGETTALAALAFTYDAAGRRLIRTVSGQATMSYAWDNANRLTTLTQGTQTVAFTYDNANRRTRITLPNGIDINYMYDAASQLTGIIYQQGATTLGDLSYSYDNAGRRTSVSGSFARTDLPAAIATSAVNANNQLTRWSAPTLAYDLNGNLTTDGVYSYTWNARNQLTQVQQGATTIATYQYDAFGRRQQKVVNGIATQFVYDGKNFVQERDANSAVTANLLTGLGLDEVYARTKGANTSSYLMDHLGTIIAEADAAGAIQTSYSYESYGKTAQTGALSDTSQRFTGREQDTVDLYYFRARYYSPTFDRFVSEDPIGIAGGMNIYQYVRGNPVSRVDLTGLESIACKIPLPDPLDCLRALWECAKDIPERQRRCREKCAKDIEEGRPCSPQKCAIDECWPSFESCLSAGNWADWP